MVESDMTAFLPFTATGACSAKSAADAEAFFKDKMTQAVGGPRNLAQAVENIRLCAAKREAQQAGLAEFLKTY
jgi:alanyl aminopeptidase